MEDWSSMNKTQRFGYYLIRYLGKLQQLCYDYIIGEPVWRCADGKCIPISKLENNHLANIIHMLERNNQQKELLNALKTEYAKRYIQLKYRRGEDFLR